MRKRRESYNPELVYRSLDWTLYYTKRTLLLGVFTVITVALLGHTTLFSGGIGELSSEHRNDDRVFEVASSELDTVKTQYTPEKEGAWCIFGEKTDDRYIVEEIVRADIYHQDRRSVGFWCYTLLADEDRIVDMVKNDYKLIGDIHSHPPEGSASPSSVDTFNHGLRTLFIYEIQGIYHEDDGLEVYTPQSLGSGLQIHKTIR